MNTIEKYVFPVSFSIFIISGYLIHPTPTWAIIFYAIIAPTFTIIIFKEKKELFGLFKNKILITSAILILWFLLTISWGVNQPEFNVKKYISRSLVNLIFLFTATYFFSKCTRWKDFLFKALPYAVLLNILISIVLFYAIDTHTLNDRLTGWAETRHPILGSLVILTGFCISFYQSQISTEKKYKIFYATVCLFCVFFVILTQSRGPFLTLFCIGIIFSIFSGKVVRRCTAGILFSIVSIFLLSDEIQQHAIQSLSRNPWRFEIWMDAWKYIQDAPIIGNGLASLNTFGAIEQKFPHSIYVSSAFFGGAIGLFLLLALFAQLAWAAWNTEDRTTKAFHLGLLCVPIIGGLTDLAQVSKSPGELWYILWVPVTIIIGHSIKSHREQKQQAQQTFIE
ncbi:O-antigen ligase [Thalassospira xiamenensis M-5 = DSM 17429]|uniref:O-antigen ligase-related domain-containing protein n=1 Tax=Thalassospira xiamenensis M-5 = DSM 17429 TaxID=1123366 RepID=A0AB72UBE1_9PROT|nr:O-antigen ligase family protein [Thalassospira xiamenensis]AJD51433.1 hypothetical protein TH3_06565 [Thalassospira xiamenensis M-5 = DSM 17429]SIT28174.1 O-antigen ligase [Thalassospira xiamenensis M-5 = DSM 17429]